MMENRVGIERFKMQDGWDRGLMELDPGRKEKRGSKFWMDVLRVAGDKNKKCRWIWCQGICMEKILRLKKFPYMVSISSTNEEGKHALRMTRKDTNNTYMGILLSICSTISHRMLPFAKSTARTRKSDWNKIAQWSHPNPLHVTWLSSHKEPLEKRAVIFCTSMSKPQSIPQSSGIHRERNIWIFVILDEVT